MSIIRFVLDQIRFRLRWIKRLDTWFARLALMQMLTKLYWIRVIGVAERRRAVHAAVVVMTVIAVGAGVVSLMGPEWCTAMGELFAVVFVEV